MNRNRSTAAVLLSLLMLLGLRQPAGGVDRSASSPRISDVMLVPWGLFGRELWFSLTTGAGAVGPVGGPSAQSGRWRVGEPKAKINGAEEAQCRLHGVTAVAVPPESGCPFRAMTQNDLQHQRGRAFKIYQPSTGQSLIAAIDEKTFEVFEYRTRPGGVELVSRFFSANGDPYLEIGGSRLRVASPPDVLKGVRAERADASGFSVDSIPGNPLRRCWGRDDARGCEFLNTPAGRYEPAYPDEREWDEDVAWVAYAQETTTVCVVNTKTGEVKLQTSLSVHDEDGLGWGRILRLEDGQLLQLSRYIARKGDDQTFFRYRLFGGKEGIRVSEVALIK